MSDVPPVDRALTLAERRVYADALGIAVDETRDTEALKRARRRAVLRWHPDKSGDAATAHKFQAAHTAYAKLLADNQLWPPPPPQQQQPPTYVQGYVFFPWPARAAAAAADERFAQAPKRTYDEAFAAYDAHLAGDIYSHSYSRTNAAGAQPLLDAHTGRSASIVVYEVLTLRQAAVGCTRRIVYRRQAMCSECTLETHTSCAACRATRYRFVDDAHNVVVPPGAAEGDRLVVRGAAHECHRASARGDLIVQLGVVAWHVCRVHRHRDYEASAKHSLAQTFARLTTKLRAAFGASAAAEAVAAAAEAAAAETESAGAPPPPPPPQRGQSHVRWHVAADVVCSTKLLHWTIDGPYDVAVRRRDDDGGGGASGADLNPAGDCGGGGGAQYALRYTRHGAHVLVVKQIGVEQAIGAFSFAMCDLFDASRLVVVHKSPRRVTVPGTVLCVRGGGLDTKAPQQRGHLFVRLAVAGIRELGAAARRRWNSLLALEAAERAGCKDRSLEAAERASVPFVRASDTLIVVDNRPNTSYRVHTVDKQRRGAAAAAPASRPRSTGTAAHRSAVGAGDSGAVAAMAPH